MALEEVGLKATIQGLNPFMQGVDRIDRGMQGLSARMVAIGHIAAEAFMTVARVVGDVAGDVVNTAADFESQMALMGIAAKGAGGDIDQLRQFAIEMGAQTFESAQGAAEGMTNLLRAGLSANEVYAAFPPITDLAAASTLSLAQASDAVTVAMKTFGLSADDAESIVNSFVRSADASVAEVNQLVDAIGSVGPVAETFGLSLEETNTALAVLSQRGLRGAEAGTALRSMLLNLNRPTNQVRDTLKALGISLYDARGAIRPFPLILGDMSKAFAGLTEQQRNQAAQTLAGTYGINALNALLEGSAVEVRNYTEAWTESDYGYVIDSWQQMSAAIEGAASAQEIAAARFATTRGQLEQLRGGLETIAIQIGTPFLENVISPILDALNNTFLPAITDILSGRSLVDTLKEYFSLDLTDVMEIIQPLLDALSVAGSFIGDAIGAIFGQAGRYVGPGAEDEAFRRRMEGMSPAEARAYLAERQRTAEALAKGVETFQATQETYTGGTFWEAARRRGAIGGEAQAALAAMGVSMGGPETFAMEPQRITGQATLIDRLKMAIGGAAAVYQDFNVEMGETAALFEDKTFGDVLMDYFDIDPAVITQIEEGWDRIREVIETTVGAVWGWIRDNLDAFISTLSGEDEESLAGRLTANFDFGVAVAEAIQDAWDILKIVWEQIIKPFAEWVAGNVQAFIDTLTGSAPFHDAVVDNFALGTALANALKAAWETLRDIWETAIKPFVDWVAAKLGGFFDALSGGVAFKDAVLDAFGIDLAVVQEKIETAWGLIWTAWDTEIRPFLEEAGSKVQEFVDQITSGASLTDALDAIGVEDTTNILTLSGALRFLAIGLEEIWTKISAMTPQDLLDAAVGFTALFVALRGGGQLLPTYLVVMGLVDALPQLVDAAGALGRGDLKGAVEGFFAAWTQSWPTFIGGLILAWPALKAFVGVLQPLAALPWGWMISQLASFAMLGLRPIAGALSTLAGTAFNAIATGLTTIAAAAWAAVGPWGLLALGIGAAALAIAKLPEMTAYHLTVSDLLPQDWGTFFTVTLPNTLQAGVDTLEAAWTNFWKWEEGGTVYGILMSFKATWDTFWSETIPMALSFMVQAIGTAWWNFWKWEEGGVIYDIMMAIKRGWDTFWTETVPNAILAAKDAIIDAIKQAIIDPFRSAFEDIGRIQVPGTEKAIWEVFAEAIPGFQAGGLTRAGVPALVGETGPELFVPQTNGAILPANQTADLLAMLAGGGRGLTINNYGPVYDAEQIEVDLRQRAALYGFGSS